MNMTKQQTIIFYILSFTWGILMSTIGLLVMLALAPFGRVRRFHNRLYGVIGKDWGGLELGCFFIVGSNCQTLSTKQHECGHGIQNIIWGPLFPIVIGIPSAIRYWYREYIYRTDCTKYRQLPSYYAIWFEGQASDWGEKVYPHEYVK